MMLRPIDLQQTLAKVTELERVEQQRLQHELVHQGEAAAQARDAVQLLSRQVNRPSEVFEARVEPDQHGEERKRKQRKRQPPQKSRPEATDQVDTIHTDTLSSYQKSAAPQTGDSAAPPKHSIDVKA